MTVQEAITSYVGAFVDELARAGVKHVVISPGSRSTPMAMLMASHPEWRAWVLVDERSAAFFALGMAKARREPVALLCTSGTAAANYFPAVVEAYHARVPLIVLTADRPHELRDVGAPQAIDQIGLYGSYVKWFVEMALPENSPSMLQYARTVAGRAAAVALDSPSGPVHLNFPFREPFIPSLDKPKVDAAARGGERPYVQVKRGTRRLGQPEVARLARILRSAERGLIVCGPMDDDCFPQAVVRLAERLQFPVLADPLSQLRSGTHDKTLVIDGYDSFLRHPGVAARLQPDVVIRFGAMPVSKAFLLYMKEHSKCRYVVVDDSEGWREPTLLASDVIYADPVHLCEELVREWNECEYASRNTWADEWIELNRITQEEILRQVSSSGLFEGRVFPELVDCLPDQALLFAGNSMPVRDMDTFFMNNHKNVRTMGNRGASGIDGVVSTALGAGVDGPPLVLVIGDLSFYHDLNGLLAAKLYQLNATVVVLNNDGGGIFSFLPQAEHRKHFETLFGTPVGLDFRHAVDMYGGTFRRVNDWEAFRTEVKTSLSKGGLTVIEVPTDREENAAKHRAIWQAVSHRIRTWQEEGGSCASR